MPLQNVNIFEGFKVDKEENLYKLTCGQVVEDPLGLADGWFSVNGMPFSTQDRDNDQSIKHCSITGGGSGGQWYKDCVRMYFNAEYPSFPGEKKMEHH